MSEQVTIGQKFENVDAIPAGGAGESPPLGKVCQHDRLERSCSECDAAKEIARLQAELAEAKIWIGTCQNHDPYTAAWTEWKLRATAAESQIRDLAAKVETLTRERDEANMTVRDRDSELDREREFDSAIHEDSKAMLRQVLGKDLWNTFWGPQLEQLCEAFDRIGVENKNLSAQLAASAARVKTLEAFANDMAEQDCSYPVSPCLTVHISQLSHGLCDGCKARCALAHPETKP